MLLDSNSNVTQQEQPPHSSVELSSDGACVSATVAPAAAATDSPESSTTLLKDCNNTDEGNDNNNNNTISSSSNIIQTTLEPSQNQQSPPSPQPQMNNDNSESNQVVNENTNGMWINSLSNHRITTISQSECVLPQENTNKSSNENKKSAALPSSSSTNPLTAPIPVITIPSNAANLNDVTRNLQMIAYSIESTADFTKRRKGIASSTLMNSTLNNNYNTSTIDDYTYQQIENSNTNNNNNPWRKAASYSSHSLQQLPVLKSLRDHECEIETFPRTDNNNNNNNNNNEESSELSSLLTNTSLAKRGPRSQCLRCQSTMKYVYHSVGGGIVLDAPLEVYYADFKGIFSRKMECHTLPRSHMKDFLGITYLPHIRELAFFIIERPLLFGLEDFVFDSIEAYTQTISTLKEQHLLSTSSNTKTDQLMFSKSESKETRQLANIPKEISSYFPSKKHEATFDFGSFAVLGNFEGANIAFSNVNAEKNKCQILMRGDTNTQGCLHWFMFTVRVKHEISISTEDSTLLSEQGKQSQQLQPLQPVTLQFSILNNKRSGLLYRDGMQIAVLDSSKPNKGWHRGGESIYYYKSNVDHSFFSQGGSNSNSAAANAANAASAFSKKARSGFQTMDFSYTFVPPSIPQIQQQSTATTTTTTPSSQEKYWVEQRVTFAYCYPYSLSDLVGFLEREEVKLISSGGVVESQSLDQNKRVMVIKTQRILYRKKTIGCSRLGLPIVLVRITGANRLGARKRKRDIFIIARQHPGETPSSFVCEGFISYLLTESEGAKFLLDHFVFKIVPMMNPDGVVVGNSRCNISGADLNRKWDAPDAILQPEVFEVKKRMKKSSAKRGVYLFCDLHGHSMKKHAFFYGCNKANESTGTTSWANSRLLPKILASKTKHFSMEECRFRVTEDKKNTARVVAWQEIKIRNSFTLETSFYGYDDTSNENKPTHFTIADLKKLGRQLCESIVDFYLMDHTLRVEVRECGGNLRAAKQDCSNIVTAAAAAGFSAQSTASTTASVSLKVSRYVGQAATAGSSGGNNFSQSDYISAQKSDSSNITPISASSTTGGGGIQSTTTTAAAVSGQQQQQQSQMNSSGVAGAGILLGSTQIGGISSAQKAMRALVTPSNRSKQRKISDEQSANLGVRTTATHTNMRAYLLNNNNSESEESEREALASMSKCTNPLKKKDWRQYFSKEELERNFKRILRGDDPNEAEAISGSDSDAEADIFKGSDLLYARQAIVSNSKSSNNNNSNQNNAQSSQLSQKKSIGKSNAGGGSSKHPKKNRSATLEMKTVSALTLAQQQQSQQQQATGGGQISQQLSTTNGNSAMNTQKSKWRPSPLIQNYKIQMEMKKQNLKKQSYPIAKIGQNFSSQQQQANSATATAAAAAATTAPALDVPTSLLDQQITVLQQQQQQQLISQQLYKETTPNSMSYIDKLIQPNNNNINIGGDSTLSTQFINGTITQSQTVGGVQVPGIIPQQSNQQQQQQLQQGITKNSINSVILQQYLAAAAAAAATNNENNTTQSPFLEQQISQKQQSGQKSKSFSNSTSNSSNMNPNYVPNPSILSSSISFYRKRMEKRNAAAAAAAAAAAMIGADDNISNDVLPFSITQQQDLKMDPSGLKNYDNNDKFDITSTQLSQTHQPHFPQTKQNQPEEFAAANSEMLQMMTMMIGHEGDDESEERDSDEQQFCIEDTFPIQGIDAIANVAAAAAADKNTKEGGLYKNAYTMPDNIGWVPRNVITSYGIFDGSIRTGNNNNNSNSTYNHSASFVAPDSLSGMINLVNNSNMFPIPSSKSSLAPRLHNPTTFSTFPENSSSSASGAANLSPSKRRDASLKNVLNRRSVLRSQQLDSSPQSLFQSAQRAWCEEEVEVPCWSSGQPGTSPPFNSHTNNHSNAMPFSADNYRNSEQKSTTEGLSNNSDGKIGQIVSQFLPLEDTFQQPIQSNSQQLPQLILQQTFSGASNNPLLNRSFQKSPQQTMTSLSRTIAAAAAGSSISSASKPLITSKQITALNQTGSPTTTTTGLNVEQEKSAIPFISNSSNGESQMTTQTGVARKNMQRSPWRKGSAGQAEVQQQQQQQQQQPQFKQLPLSQLQYPAIVGNPSTLGGTTGSTISTTTAATSAVMGEKRVGIPTEFQQKKTARKLNGTFRYLNTPLSKLEIESMMHTTAVLIGGNPRSVTQASTTTTTTTMNAQASSSTTAATSNGTMIMMGINTVGNGATTTTDGNIRYVEHMPFISTTAALITNENRKRKDRAKSTLLSGKSPQNNQQLINQAQVDRSPTACEDINKEINQIIPETTGQQKNPLSVYRPAGALMINNNSMMITSTTVGTGTALSIQPNSTSFRVRKVPLV